MFNFKAFNTKEEFDTLIEPLMEYWETLPKDDKSGMFKELLSGILMSVIVTIKSMPPKQSSQLINLVFNKDLTEQELADRWYDLNVKFGNYHILDSAYLTVFLLLITRVANIVKEMEENGEDFPSTITVSEDTLSPDDVQMLRMLANTKFSSMN